MIEDWFPKLGWILGKWFLIEVSKGYIKQIVLNCDQSQKTSFYYFLGDLKGFNFL